MAVSRTKPTKREKELEAQLAASKVNEMAANNRAIQAEKALKAGPPEGWPTATEREQALARGLEAANARINALRERDDARQRAADMAALDNFTKLVDTMRGQSDDFLLVGAVMEPAGVRTIVVPLGNLRRTAVLVERYLIADLRSQTEKA